MNRAKIFFSHSSQDKSLLSLLKEMILLKTSNSIDVFLSSDGQSIPFGRNWVYEVQKAMDDTSLMFCFLTPHSIGSQWLLFEAGFAYSKRIRVVPVGIMGVDIGTIKPPLGLLQGFNITSHHGLGNIVAVLNETLGSTFDFAFAAEDFQALMDKSTKLSGGPLGQYGSVIDNMKLSLTERDGLKRPFDQAIGEIARILNNSGIDHQYSEQGINLPGVDIFVRRTTQPPSLDFEIDPILLHISIPTINKILNWSMNHGARGVTLTAFFDIIVGCVLERHKLSARLYGSPATAKDENSFTFLDIDFRLSKSRIITGRSTTEGNASISMTFVDTNISVDSMRSLIVLLFENEVLYFHEGVL